jgi:sugar-specific transcriptional regulator TrmB
MKQFTIILMVTLLFISVIPQLTLPPVCHADIKVWGIRGEMWDKVMSESDKRFYIQGMLDALIAAEEYSKKPISYSTSIENYIKALDQFYNDYRNELIPVFWGLRIVSLELKGSSQIEVDQELRDLRKRFHKIAEEMSHEKDPSDKQKKNGND